MTGETYDPKHLAQLTERIQNFADPSVATPLLGETPSSHRPYDPNQLARLTEHMRHNGPVVSPAGPPEPAIVHEAGFEHYPGRIEEARVATRGLAQLFTVEGRADRAREKAARLRQRNQVIVWVGDRIINPSTATDPVSRQKEKFGWLGTHKTRVTVGKQADAYDGDFTHMGEWLLKRSNDITEPNQNRPTTRSEERGSRRLEAKQEKRKRLAQESRWLDNSYRSGSGGGAVDSDLARGAVSLTHKERKHARRVSRRIEKLDNKVDRLMNGSNILPASVKPGLDTIAHNQDIRGQIATWRIRRNETRAAKLDKKIRHRGA